MNASDFRKQWASEYRGYTIELTKHWSSPYHLAGRYITLGFVIVKDGCNAMPGALWCQSEREAQECIDCFIDHPNDFWDHLKEYKGSFSNGKLNPA